MNFNLEEEELNNYFNLSKTNEGRNYLINNNIIFSLLSSLSPNSNSNSNSSPPLLPQIPLPNSTISDSTPPLIPNSTPPLPIPNSTPHPPLPNSSPILNSENEINLQILILKIFNNCLRNFNFNLKNNLIEKNIISNLILNFNSFYFNFKNENKILVLNYFLILLKILNNFIFNCNLSLNYFWNFYGLKFIFDSLNKCIFFNSSECLGLLIALLHSCISKNNEYKEELLNGLFNLLFIILFIDDFYVYF